MKIAFFQPALPQRVNPDAKASCSKHFPHGILSLASFLRKEFPGEIEIKYFEDYGDEGIVSRIFDFSPDIVGISSMTPMINRAYYLSDILRAQSKSVVVLGGRHPSALPQESIQHADYVIVGEGERGFADLVRTMRDGREPQQRIIQSAILQNLDSIYPLTWDLLDMENYFSQEKVESVAGKKAYRKVARLITSRGCNYRCIFCCNSKDFFPVRFLSAQRVIQDIEYMIQEWKVEKVFFEDDDFLADQNRLKEICELIHQKKLSFTWTCLGNISMINQQILDMVFAAGCRQINYGLESGSNRILRFLKGSHASVERNRQIVRMTHKAGMRVQGYFIFGTPTETIQDMIRTMWFIMSNPIFKVALNVATAYPNTALWDYCLKQKLMLLQKLDYDSLYKNQSIWKVHKQYLNKNKVMFPIFWFLYALITLYCSIFTGSGFGRLIFKIKRFVPRFTR